MSNQPRRRGPMGGGHGRMGTGEKAKDFKGTMKKLFTYLSEYKIGIFFVMIFAIGSTVFNIVGPKILGKATTEIFKGLVGKVSGGSGIDFTKIGKILLTLLCLYVISACFSFIQGYIMTGVSQKLTYRMRKEISEKINRMPMNYFDTTTHGEVLSRVTNAQPKIANYHFTTLSPNLGVVDLEGCSGFVIADIPGLIEGASEGVGLGHEFLRHIERTRVIIHIVDAASVEGRDPVEDIHKINKELEAYNPEIAARPQVIAANKIDCIFDDGEESPIDQLKAEFEPQGISVYPISAVTGQGVRELLFHVKELLDKSPMKPVVFEQEFFPEDVLVNENLPFTVERSEEDPEVFLVEGPKIEKMLGYTNLDSEKGFAFFQKFLKEGGILEELEKAGIQEGDTVRMYGFDFDYYK